MIARNECRAGSRPCDARAGVELLSDELVLKVAPAIELASGATLVQGLNKSPASRAKSATAARARR